ncbi:hypothetical protein C8J56DRAFT_773493 [Mycena floridula]|nr:hypothetical protein C8J56DRAFT_773493 [Mycena floridula]
MSEDTEKQLQGLVDVADLLGIQDVSFTSYSSALTRLSENDVFLKRTLDRLAFVEQELEGHLAAMQHEQALIRSWNTQIDTQPVSLDAQRDSMLKKAKEYQKELNLLKENAQIKEPSVTVTDLMTMQEKNEKRAQNIKLKRSKIKTFQGLPPNLDLAKNELRKARDEHMKLLQLRERLLNNMAQGLH